MRSNKNIEIVTDYFRQGKKIKAIRVIRKKCPMAIRVELENGTIYRHDILEKGDLEEFMKVWKPAVQMLRITWDDMWADGK